MNQAETEAIIFATGDIVALAKSYKVTNRVNQLRKTLGLHEIRVTF